MSGQVRSPYEPAGTNNLEGLLFPATYPVRQGETTGRPGAVHGRHVRLPRRPARVGGGGQEAPLQPLPGRDRGLDRRTGGQARGRPGPDRLGHLQPPGRGDAHRGRVDPPVRAGGPEGRGGHDHRPTRTTPWSTRACRRPRSPTPAYPRWRRPCDPPHTSYLYWVEVNPDGKMGFASTTAGFHQLQRECRAVHLC